MTASHRMARVPHPRPAEENDTSPADVSGEEAIAAYLAWRARVIGKRQAKDPAYTSPGSKQEES